MFFNPSERTVGSTDSAELAAPPPRDAGFWILLIVRNSVDITTILLNGLVLGAVIIDKQKRFRVDYYHILAAFMILMVLECSSNVYYSVYSEILENQSAFLDCASSLLDIFTTYYSVLIIALLGFNRYVNFTMPKWRDTIFSKKVLFPVLVVSSVGMFAFSYLILYLSGVDRSVDTTMGVQEDYAEDLDLITKVNYVSYLIPILSSYFYIRVYFHLRAQRVNAISGKTKEMLDKAELCTLNQGRLLLIVYVLALVCNLTVTHMDVPTVLEIFIIGVKKPMELTEELYPVLELPRAAAGDDEKDESERKDRKHKKHRKSKKGKGKAKHKKSKHSKDKSKKRRKSGSKDKKKKKRKEKKKEDDDEKDGEKIDMNETEIKEEKTEEKKENKKEDEKKDKKTEETEEESKESKVKSKKKKKEKEKKESTESDEKDEKDVEENAENNEEENKHWPLIISIAVVVLAMSFIMDVVVILHLAKILSVITALT